MAWEFRAALALIEPTPLGFGGGEAEAELSLSAPATDPFQEAREAGAKVRAM